MCHEVGYTDEKNFSGKVCFGQPLREFLQKEVALYNYFNGVPTFPQVSLAQHRFKSGQRAKQGAPTFGSTDLLVQGFFSHLQANFNVNTVPTVIRLTSKLLKPDLSQIQYPFCPLCLGVRDQITNLLEVSSTIKAIQHGAEEVKVETVQSPDEWFKTELETALCFGCKRMAIEALNKDGFLERLP